MRLEIGMDGLEIHPESEQDEAYIRHTLGLKKENDTILLVRKDRYLSGHASYLETQRKEKE